jgi:phospholipid transport system substrate-binding protein
MTRAWAMVVIGLVLGGASPALASVSPAGSPSRSGRDGCPGESRAGVDPLNELRQTDLALSAALKRRVPDWSPEAAVHAARIDGLLAEILDYEAIARQALRAHWDALSAAQRSAFLALFSPLTNRVLVSAAERRVSVSYDSESVSGPEATVVVTPRSPDETASPVTRIEYKLRQHCGGWRIHDVIVDGVSLVDGYRAQFDKLLRKGTFDDVLAIMRRKLRSTAAQ